MFPESVHIQIVKFAKGAPITVCDAVASLRWLYTRVLRAQGTPLKCAVTSDQRGERALLQQNGRMPQAMLQLQSSGSDSYRVSGKEGLANVCGVRGNLSSRAADE